MFFRSALITRILVGCLLAASAVVTSAQTSGVRDTTWTLSSVPGRALVAGATATLGFEKDRVTGSDGCNRFTAPYTSSGTSLQVGSPAASTRMACPEPVSAQALAFMNAVTRARAYRINEGQLQLLGEDGGVLATLAAQPATLAGTTWRVTGYNNGKQAVTSVLGGTTLTMAFGADRRVSGSAGCNTYAGPYMSDGTKLTFGLAATTRKMCTGTDRIMEQEQQFLVALGTVAVMHLEGDRLELRTAAGAMAITLTRWSLSRSSGIAGDDHCGRREAPP